MKEGLGTLESIYGLNGEKGNKYLGILEANDIKHEQMKDKITKDLFERLKKPQLQS